MFDRKLNISQKHKADFFSENIVDELLDWRGFKEAVTAQAIVSFGEADLEPKLDEEELFAAYKGWLHDMTRIPNDSMFNDDDSETENVTPDHFKSAGILAYWLRRFPPVYNLASTQRDGRNINVGDDLSSRWHRKGPLRNFLLDYHQVYLSFDMGFCLCDFFESYQEENPSKEEKILSWEYLKTVCYFLKYKNVSPHALILIYKSLWC